MEKDLPLKLDRETLGQMATEQLVDIIIEQAIVTQTLNKRILELEQEVEKLKVSRDLDSQTSSKLYLCLLRVWKRKNSRLVAGYSPRTRHRDKTSILFRVDQ
jgi:hypothetical protein